MNTTENAIDNRLEALTNLSQGDFKAFLYDCDGTLADNMGAHRDTYVHIASKAGLTIDGDMIDELAGWPVVNVVEEINKRYNSTFDPVAFAQERQQLFFDEYIEKTLPIDFVVNHLKAHAGKVKIGVVSGGQRASVEKTLNLLVIRHLADVLVCANETPRGKPFPDPFLAAAEKLGVAPQDCLVFEDGDPGVQSAEAAGMKWIRIDKV
ncbi:HAD family phosphatase [Mucilaginibacter hurinus]|uniref:HAD family phosphatase n=1 Tax=Mucilaginibacter hurinus TaxID=2201324 RepID=A0A367GUB2_9SPHI|nr:HAD-IA family hydrolase [Mucilaginibacter hurinus]RCH56283.1 HAD family phosphatase [Mucilaginibacter hurinus]